MQLPRAQGLGIRGAGGAAVPAGSGGRPAGRPGVPSRWRGRHRRAVVDWPWRGCVWRSRIGWEAGAGFPWVLWWGQSRTWGTVQDLGDSPGLGGMWGREKKWGTARHSRRVPGQDVAPWGITPLNKPRNRILASQACNTGLPGTAQGVPGTPRLDPESQVGSIRSLGAPCQGCSQEILLWGRPWRFGSRVLLGTAVG